MKRLRKEARSRVRKGRSLPVVCIFLLFAFVPHSSGSREYPAVLPPPVLSSAHFPCSECHAMNGNMTEVRGRTAHGSIRIEGHMEGKYGCFACHDRKNLDTLILFNGSRIRLTASSELCGQCHSTNYKLWQSGLHGKVAGKWNGPQQIIPCTSCHDPHRPGYATFRPGPPPTPPEQTLWRRR